MLGSNFGEKSQARKFFHGYVVSGQLFFGYPLFRILLILNGLINGLSHSLVPDCHPGLSLVIGLGAAVVLAMLAYPLWSIGVIVVGVALGFIILISLQLALNASQTVLILLGAMGAAAIGLLFYHVRDLFVMLTTAFNGAVLVILSLCWYSWPWLLPGRPTCRIL